MRGFRWLVLLLLLCACREGRAQVPGLVAIRASASSVPLGDAITLEVSVKGTPTAVEEGFRSLITQDLAAFSLNLESISQEKLSGGTVRELRVFKARCYQLGRINVPSQGPSRMTLEVLGRLDPKHPGEPENPLQAGTSAWRQWPWIGLIIAFVGCVSVTALISIVRSARQIQSRLRHPENPPPWSEALDRLRQRWSDRAATGAVPPAAAYDLSCSVRAYLLIALNAAPVDASTRSTAALSHEQAVALASRRLASSAVTEPESVLRLLWAGEAANLAKDAAPLSAQVWNEMLDEADGLAWLHSCAGLTAMAGAS